MRKLLISLAAGATVLAAATPAAAQYQQRHDYNGGPGYNRGGVDPRELQARIDNLQRQIDSLGRSGRVRGESAGHLMEETRQLEYRLRSAARNGLRGYEARDIQQRIGLIESRVRYAAGNGNGRGYGDRNGRWNRGY